MSREELIEKTEAAINELVRPKTAIQKAYNYYNGIRDREQFKYLEDNFGIGNSTQVELTPLIKKHIDALLGEFLGTPIIPKISCKDSETINNINRDKQLHIAAELNKFLQSKLRNSILQFIDKGNITDVNIQQQLEQLKEDLSNDFTSEYEIASQNVLQYIMQSRRTDFNTKLRYLLLDLLISGYLIYQCKPSVNNNNVTIETLDPRDTFIDINPESIYLKDAFRAVVRRWMSKEQILNKYGRDLKSDDIKKIKENWEKRVRNNGAYYITSRPGSSVPIDDGDLDDGVNVQYGFPERGVYYNSELIPVYEVQWTQTDNKFVMHRYQTIRISEDIYILKGEDEDVIRSIDNPSYCGLSINGIYMTNRSSRPYSLMIACMGLQDRYDCLNFIRDSLILNSGTIGDYVDVSMLPSFLGPGPTEKIMKYIAYKKQGLAVIDSAQEGRLQAGVGQANTWMNGFDDTIKAPAIQAIQMAIDAVEQTVSSITGVFRERLNGIEQHDAVTNVKIGAQNSFIITKQYYQQMDLATAEILCDALNVAKKVFKNGLTGTIILGDKLQKTFTALPQHFTMTDWDVHVVTSTDVVKDLETIRTLIPEFVKSGIFTPDIILEAITSKSVTQLKNKALLAMRKQEQKNDVVNQLQQQTEQLKQQLQDTTKQLEQAQKKLEALNEQKLQIEQEKIQQDARIAWYQAQTDRTYKNDKNEIDKKKVQLEAQEMYDGNPFNDKVNFGK